MHKGFALWFTGLSGSGKSTLSERIYQRLVAAGAQGLGLGLQINAGHGITTSNLGPLLRIPGLAELNIGHHIVSRAVFIGLRAAVAEMLVAMAGGNPDGN